MGKPVYNVLNAAIPVRLEQVLHENSVIFRKFSLYYGL